MGQSPYDVPSVAEAKLNKEKTDDEEQSEWHRAGTDVSLVSTGNR